MPFFCGIFCRISHEPPALLHVRTGIRVRSPIPSSGQEVLLLVILVPFWKEVRACGGLQPCALSPPVELFRSSGGERALGT